MAKFTKEEEKKLFWALCDGIRKKFIFDVTETGDTPENIRVTKIDMQEPIIARAINWLEDGGYIEKTNDRTIYKITLGYYEYLKNAAN